MGIINIQIDDELEQRLRLEVVKRFQGRKGSLRRAVEEAIELWLQKT